MHGVIYSGPPSLGCSPRALPPPSCPAQDKLWPIKAFLLAVSFLLGTQFNSVVGRVISLQNCAALIPRTCECVTHYIAKETRDVIKGMGLKMGRLSSIM